MEGKDVQGFHKVESPDLRRKNHPLDPLPGLRPEGETNVSGVSEAEIPPQIPQTPEKCKGLCEFPGQDIRGEGRW